MSLTSTRQSRLRRPRTSLSPRGWLVWGLLMTGGLVMVFPVYWSFVTAVSPGGQVQSDEFFLWPREFVWSNFAEAWQEHPVADWIINSTLIAMGSTALTVVVSLLAGYAFAKYRFHGRTALFIAILVTLMVPIQVILVPTFLVVTSLGLTGTKWSVILPGAAQAIAVFMARQFMLGVPDELIEAGRVDGAGEFAIFWRVVLPSCGPLIGVLIILNFVWRWNDFVWPLIALQGDENFTLPIGLNSLNTIYQVPWETIMAVSLISVLPVLVVFVVFQRQFVQGIASSGLK